MSGVHTGDGQARVGDELKQQASELGTKAQQKLDQTTEQLAEQARSFGAEQKSLGAEQLSGLAKAAHIAAQELEQRMPMAASLAHSTAEQIDHAALALRERSLGQLLDDIGDFARREPVLFFGGAVVAGFALSRFLKSSASDLDDDDHDQKPSSNGSRGTQSHDRRAANGI